jgi:single-strand DNA-binding protein
MNTTERSADRTTITQAALAAQNPEAGALDTGRRCMRRRTANRKEKHMRDIATATLSGNLTRDVELKQLPSSARRRHGEEWVEKTNYFTVEVYGAQARACAQYLAKGSRVLVDAELDWREWTDQQQNKREAVTFRARQVLFEGAHAAPTAGEDVGEQNGAAPDGAGQPGADPVGVASAEGDTSASADDLPF